jgi:hypothetical protein
VKALVAGWFSFPEMGATAGDLLTRDVVCRWLTETGREFDVALAAPFEGGVDWRTVDPRSFTDVVFVCGPFGNGWPIPELLARFAGCRLTGVNVSMLQPLSDWNPFDLLFERDSSATVRPDVSLLAEPKPVPVVGVVLVHPQREYGKAYDNAANEAIERFIASRPMAVVRIDTRLDVNATGLRTSAEVEAVIRRMDVVLTTRLHGLVLSLKNGVPPIAIDPVVHGAKVLRQARALEWPSVFTTSSITAGALQQAFDWSLTPVARVRAERCRAQAVARLQRVRERFMAALTPGTEGVVR